MDDINESLRNDYEDARQEQKRRDEETYDPHDPTPLPEDDAGGDISTDNK